MLRNKVKYKALKPFKSETIVIKCYSGHRCIPRKRTFSLDGKNLILWLAIKTGSIYSGDDCDKF